MGEVKWVERPGRGRLGILPKPRGNGWFEENAGHIRAEGCDVLVSFLTDEEMKELALEDEGRLCRRHGIEFVRFAFENFAVPPFEPDTVLFIRALAEQLRRGRGVVLHCQTGVGRTGLMAASVLVTEEWTSDRAIQAVAKARGRPVPDNDLQRKFVELLATLDFSCPLGQERRKAYAF